MGFCLSKYIEAQVAKMGGVRGQAAMFIETLERVEYGGPGVLKLRGQSNLHNPKPPLQPSWLAGVMSPEEFTTIVSSINEAVIVVAETQPLIYRPADIPFRQKQLNDSADAALAALNEKLAQRGIALQLDRGMERVTVVDARENRHATRHEHPCTLYMTFPVVAAPPPPQLQVAVAVTPVAMAPPPSGGAWQPSPAPGQVTVESPLAAAATTGGITATVAAHVYGAPYQ